MPFFVRFLTGGRNDHHRRVVRSCSSFWMSELYESYFFCARNSGTKSGRNRCALICASLRLWMEGRKNGDIGQEALGGILGLICECPRSRQGLVPAAFPLE